VSATRLPTRKKMAERQESESGFKHLELNERTVPSDKNREGDWAIKKKKEEGSEEGKTIARNQKRSNENYKPNGTKGCRVSAN